jgi:MarR family transcriptional regulator, negative regulator of the multidrug operon emrRAB
MADLLANWTGALAGAVEAVVAQGPAQLQGSDAAALLTCSYFPDVTIGELGESLGLSGSGAVRLVDRLELAGLARRRTGPGRSVTVRPTANGRRCAARLQEQRLEAISRLLSPLTLKEQGELAKLLDKVLYGALFADQQARRVCRFCDHARCDDGACPIGRSLRHGGGAVRRSVTAVPR